MNSARVGLLKRALFGYAPKRSEEALKAIGSSPVGGSEPKVELALAIDTLKKEKERKADEKAKRGEKLKLLDDIDWVQLALAGGGGLIGHSLASSLFDGKTDEEKRKQSIWMKLLSTLLPMGVAGLGAYGGYRLGKVLKTAEDQTSKLSTQNTPVDPASAADSVASTADMLSEDASKMRIGAGVQGVSALASAAAGAYGAKQWYDANVFVNDLTNQMKKWEQAKPLREALDNAKGVLDRAKTVDRSDPWYEPQLRAAEQAYNDAKYALNSKYKELGVSEYMPSVSSYNEKMFPKGPPKYVRRTPTDMARVSRIPKALTWAGLLAMLGLGWSANKDLEKAQQLENASKRLKGLTSE